MSDQAKMGEAVALTLAICTYNRADSLARTLESIVSAAPPGGPFELIVVDNNCTDHTAEICARFAARLPLRRVLEPAQGLSPARNRAVAEARGDLLVFTDDDVLVDPEFLVAYATGAAAFPHAAYFGGRIRVAWPEPPGRPVWLRDEALPVISGLIVHYDLGTEDRPYSPADPLPYGASFALRRSLFKQAVPFRADLGVNGARPGRGEETAYLEAARKAGAQGAYLGSANCAHVTDPARLSLGYLYRYGCEKGVTAVRMGHSADGSLLREIGFIFRGLNQLVKGRGDRFRQCVVNAGIERGQREAAGGR